MSRFCIQKIRKNTTEEINIKNKTVIIHTDAVRREFAGNWVLAQALSRHGYSVSLTSRYTTERLLKIVHADIVIVSHAFTLSVKQLRILKKRGTKIFVMDVEGNYEWDDAISTTYLKNTEFNLFAGFMVWNRWTKDWLLKNRSVDEDKIHVTGSIRTSIYRHITTKKSDSKKTIGILGRFETINIFDSRHNFSLLTKHHDQDKNMEKGKYWRAFKLRRWKYELDLFSVCMDVIDLAIRKGYKINIRPHPNENVESYNIIKQYFGESVEIDTNHDYIDWLTNIDVLVGAISTAFSEAYLANIPIIGLNKMIDDHYLDGYVEWTDVNEESAHCPSTIEGIDSLLSSIVQPKKSKRFLNYLEKYYDLKNGDAIERVISVITKNDTATKLNIFKVVWFRLASNAIDIFFFLYALLGSVVKKNQYKKLKLYNCNRFMHKPSNFMKNILREKQT